MVDEKVSAFPGQENEYMVSVEEKPLEISVTGEFHVNHDPPTLNTQTNKIRQ